MKGRIRQRSPGSWQASFDLGRDPTGKRLTKAVAFRGTKAEAQRKLREMLTALDQGRNPVPADVSLRDWLDRWMSEVITPPSAARGPMRPTGTLLISTLSPAWEN